MTNQEVGALIEKRALMAAAAVYAAGTAIHTADHLRRGVEVLTLHVRVAGYIGTVLALVVMVLIFLDKPLAPVAAVAVGFPHALGISAVHLLPEWSAFSDSFIGAPVGAMSWAAVALEVGGALAVGVVGLLLMRRYPSFGSAHVGAA